jgi:hypothetical protein
LLVNRLNGACPGEQNGGSGSAAGLYRESNEIFPVRAWLLGGCEGPAPNPAEPP